MSLELPSYTPTEEELKRALDEANEEIGRLRYELAESMNLTEILLEERNALKRRLREYEPPVDEVV